MNFFNDPIKSSNLVIGKNKKIFIVAEAGVAHFGNFEKAIKLVDLAKNAGADAVKFQLFDVDNFICKSSKEWFDRMSSRSLEFEDYMNIHKYCKKKGIFFF